MKKILFLSLMIISTILISQNLYSVQDVKLNEAIPKDNVQLIEPEKIDPQADNSHFPVKFKEVWGYLMRGEEKVFKGTEPVTDVCYFSCGINSSGRINVNVTPPVLPELNGQKRRIHMVIADLENTRMMTYILDPEKDARALLVNDIIEVSKKFDGVQIDFEAVATKDSANFLEFLRMIKAGLEPCKTFSIALPAKVIKVDNAYDYKAISAIVDKVFIMAYDQHWSTSKPGPVASLSWCRDILTYAITEIPPEKLIMGIPLYGRSWKNEKIVKKIRTGKKHAKNGKKNKKRRTIIVTKNVTKSRSVKTNNISSLIAGKNIVKEYSPEAGFKLEYGGSSKEILYCDDVNATMEKFLYYREHVDSIGFWRLGMESPDMWKEITIMNN
jgi:spore germination protein YaaH